MDRAFAGKNKIQNRRLALIASISLILFPAHSYPASSPKPTIESLVAKTISDGAAEIVKPAMAEKLGYGSGQIAVKAIRIQHTVAPDGKDHRFAVVVHSDESGHPIPDALEFRVSHAQRDGVKVFVDGFIFSADVSGHLKKAFHNSGVDGDLKSEELEIGKRKTKKAFQREIDLFLANLK